MIDIETIGIEFKTDGLKAGQRELDKTTQAANKTADAADNVGDAAQRSSRQFRALESSLGTLRTVIGGLGLAVLTKEFFGMADAVTTLHNQLKLATGSSAAAAQAYQQLYEIAQRSRVSFTELGGTYAAIARAGSQLGVSQNRLLTVTEAIGNAMAISGGSAAGMQAALVQLSQGLSSGTLRGEELNSVMEQTPRLAKAIADGLGVPIGKLRELGAAGEITAEQVIKSLESQAKTLGKEVQGATLTVGQAYTQLGNAVTVFAGEADSATGASNALASAMSAVAGGITDIGKAAKEHQVAIATTLGIAGGAGLLAALPAIASGLKIVGVAIAGLGAVLAANPVVLALLGIGAAVGGFVAYNNAAQKSADGMRRTLKALEQDLNKRSIYDDRSPEGNAWFAAEVEKRKKAIQELRTQITLLDAQNLDTSAEDARLGRYNAQAIAQDALRAKLNGTMSALSGVNDKYRGQQAQLETLQQAYAAGMLTETEYLAAVGEISAALEKQYTGTKKVKSEEEQHREVMKGVLARREAFMAQHAPYQTALEMESIEIEHQNKLSTAHLTDLEKLTQTEYERANTLEDEVKKQRDANKAIGLGRLELAKLEASRLDDAAAEKTRLAAIKDGIDPEIAAEYRRQAKALQELASVKLTGALKEDAVDQLKAANDEHIKMWESIDKTAHDVFVNIFEDGAGTFKRLGQTLKAALLDMLYQMTVKKWTVNIAAQISGSGGAAGQSGGGGSGLMGTINNISSLWDTGNTVAGWLGLGSAATGTGLVATAGSGMALASTAGTGLGLTAATGTGLGLAGTGTGLGLSAAAGTGTALTAGAGASAGAAGGAGLMSTAAAAVPYIAAIVAIVSLISGLDDSGTYHTGGAASAGPAGLRQGTTAESLGFESTVVADATTKAMEQTATSMAAMFNSLGKGAFNVSTAFADDTSKDGAWGALRIERDGQKLLDWNDGRTSRWAPKEFADGEKGLQQYTAALAVSVRDALEEVGLPDWATDMLGALGDAPTFEQISGVMQSITVVDQTMETLGRGMSAFANISDEAVTALAEATGGIANLQAGLGYFYQEFFSESDRIDIATAQLTEGLAELGQQLPETRAEFKDMVNAAIEAGDEDLAAKLLAFSGAVASILPATEDATAAAAAAAAEQRVDREKALWQQQADAAASLRGEVQGLFDALGGHITDLRAQALGPVLNAQQGQAFIDQALQAALGAGVLPDQADLETAIAAVRGGLGVGAGQYGNSIDAAYATAKLAGDLETLQGVAGQQLTQAERQYQAAVTQIEQLDKSLGLATEQNALTQTGIDATLSVVDAVHELTDVLDPSGAKRGGSRSGPGQNYIMGGAGGYMTFADGTSGWVSQDHSGGSYRLDEPSYSPQSHQYLQGLGVYASTDSQDLFGDLSHLVAAQLQAAFWSPEADQATTLEKWAGEMFYGSTEAALAAVSGLIDQGIIDSYRGLPQLAVGTNYIPQDGAYYLHKGESVQPAAYNPAAGGMTMGGTQRLEALFTEMLSRITSLEGVIAEGNAYTKSAADTLNRVAPGDALTTQAAPTF